MKKFEIASVVDALAKIRLTKIENKEFRKQLAGVYFNILSEQKKFEVDRESLETVHLGSYKEERQEIGKLQQQFNEETDQAKRAEINREIEGHTELIAAVQDYNAAVLALGSEEIEIDGLAREELLAELIDQDLELGQLSAIEAIMK